MFPIWYILHCEDGKEKRAVELLKQQYHSPNQADIFLITFEKMKRYEGSWHCQEELLLSGYVFADAKDREHLEKAARNTSVFEMSGTGEFCVCLEETEKKFLKEICGDEHCIPMSKGYIRNGITFVTEGPLYGKECRIRKIDRHKRLARIDSLLGNLRKRELWMGLEIMAKS